MSVVFPSHEWLKELEEKLNSDQQYGKIASKWEGDLLFQIEPEGNLKEPIYYYIDLWHGKCRGTEMLSDPSEKKAAFVLKATYGNITRILLGNLDPMQAMMTRKLQVQGSMAYMLRNVPVVLRFVHCCQEITSEIK